VVEFWYNSNFHASINCSLFNALCGRDPNLAIMLQRDGDTATDDDMDWVIHTERLREKMQRAQDHFK
jgi:hypothetical protein